MPDHWRAVRASWLPVPRGRSLTRSARPSPLMSAINGPRGRRGDVGYVKPRLGHAARRRPGADDDVAEARRSGLLSGPVVLDYEVGPTVRHRRRRRRAVVPSRLDGPLQVIDAGSRLGTGAREHPQAGRAPRRLAGRAVERGRSRRGRCRRPARRCSSRSARSAPPIAAVGVGVSVGVGIGVGVGVGASARSPSAWNPRPAAIREDRPRARRRVGQPVTREVGRGEADERARFDAIGDDAVPPEHRRAEPVADRRRRPRSGSGRRRRAGGSG